MAIDTAPAGLLRTVGAVSCLNCCNVMRRGRDATAPRPRDDQTVDAPAVRQAQWTGADEGSLAAWVKQARAEAESGLDADERAELERLRRENRELRMDREILRKAAAYFARETNR